MGLLFHLLTAYWGVAAFKMKNRINSRRIESSVFCEADLNHFGFVPPRALDRPVPFDFIKWGSRYFVTHFFLSVGDIPQLCCVCSSLQLQPSFLYSASVQALNAFIRNRNSGLVVEGPACKPDAHPRWHVLALRHLFSAFHPGTDSFILQVHGQVETQGTAMNLSWGWEMDIFIWP